MPKILIFKENFVNPSLKYLENLFTGSYKIFRLCFRNTEV